jgi:HEAT repeat protein
MRKNPSAKVLEYVSGGGDSLDRTYSRLMNSGRGVRLQQKLQEEKALRKEKIKKQIEEMKLAQSFAGEADGPADSRLMSSLLDMTEELAAGGEHEHIEVLLGHATEGLLDSRQHVRDRSSAMLAEMIEHLSWDQQALLLGSLSDTLIRWLKMETTATMAYKKICSSIMGRIGECIDHKQLDVCVPILDVFHLIDSGILEKNDTIKTIASDIIRELSSHERESLLLDALRDRDPKTRTDAGRTLARLGNTSLNLLLDVLREQTDSEERVRILHLLIEIGQPMIPIIRQRLNNYDEPWYFLRNLVYILGRIDSQSSAELLGDFLLYKNEKVQMEALKSIQRVGGSRKGPILLSALYKADESFQKRITEELGNMRYAGAAPVLLELLKMRPVMVSLSRSELEEKICFALGRIGSQEAVPLLAEISQSKSFFSKKSYPEKVKSAAARALFLIKSSSSS